jgi:hypothetical protein
MPCANDDERFRCRVCGMWQDQPPWGTDCETPSQRICSCCGTEFGYEDITTSAARMNRKRWLANGAQWFDDTDRPADWNVTAQLKCIPRRFR